MPRTSWHYITLLQSCPAVVPSQYMSCGLTGGAFFSRISMVSFFAQPGIPQLAQRCHQSSDLIDMRVLITVCLTTSHLIDVPAEVKLLS